MLKLLRIKNLAILADVTIEFGAGLNLLTGDSGAGKSILVDALGLAVGARATSDLIRTGASRAVVEGVFDVSAHPEVPALLREHGVDAEPEEEGGDGTLVVRREIGPDGNRVFCNGSPTTVGVLRSIGSRIVGIHGQHQHQSLLRETLHVEILDSYARASRLRRRVAAAHAELGGLRRRLEGVRRRGGELAERIEVLRFRASEIDAVDPKEDELADLRRERELMAHAAEIGGLVSETRQLLEEAEEGTLLAGISRLHENLARLSRFHPELAVRLEELRSARSVLEDVAAALRGGDYEMETDARRLEEVEARLSALAGLTRKYGGDLDAVLAARAQAREELGQLEGDLGSPEELEQELAQAASRLGGAAGELSQLRRRRARELEARVEEELAELGMKGTRFRVAVDHEPQTDSPVIIDGVSVRCGSRGADAVRFLLSANRGEEERPLARIASGGELSRLMLALEGALRTGDDARATAGCLIFDEVDAGVGGSPADVVGRKLARVARARQVICVTHHPQVACRAERHFRVEKRVRKGRTVTEVRALEGEERVGEIARMLGGTKVTRTTRQHAEEMISAGEEGRP